jgi:ATP/maltotriose-dependent transcriptional regulator MalT
MRSRALEAAAYLANARADYARGGAIAAEVLELCSTFRLGETRTALCLCCAASAEIGLRRFDAAAARLAEGRPGAATARHVSGEHQCLEMKLALATGRAQTILDHSEPLDDDWPGQLSERAGLLAVAAAAVGDPAAAREHAAVALELEGSIEGYFYARFGSALADMAEGSSDDDAAIGALVQETADAEMLDAFVVAYRAHPSLLARLASRRDVEALLRRVLVASNDGALARRAGIELPAPPAAATTDGLTRREAEVLGLLAEGLSNADIARRLVIAESTAKLHVHHILTKLGVRTRTQAALLARKHPHRTA